MMRPIAVVPLLLAASASLAGAQPFEKGAPSPPPAKAAQAAPMLPGGAVISALRVTVTPASGGAVKTVPIDKSGAFSLSSVAPGRYRVALISTGAAKKQTQGATFGEKVNAGLHAAGSAKVAGSTKAHAHADAHANASANASANAKVSHETAKNSVGNIRGKINPNDMPSRISMNVTVARTRHVLEVDGAPVEMVVGADGKLSGVVAPK